MINSDENLFQILYVSRLVSASDFVAVKDIVAVSRRTNPERGITGALLFDGEYFGQLLEGSEAEVTKLMQRIEADPRHGTLTVLFRGPAEEARQLRVWRSGYCETHQLGVLIGDASLRGGPALAAFMSILQGADVQ
jgi:hypothetical protein